MGLFNDIDPIFFYHKSVKPLLAMGFNGVVTPSGRRVNSVALPFDYAQEPLRRRVNNNSGATGIEITGFNLDFPYKCTNSPKTLTQQRMQMLS
jgi:hypothetical protein